mmetsp:Transcript_17956/g.42617  ORF Transcript_17956/g.42617 Transcript_17956/m.42617 type:complete len:205 (-) Transcript_17956:156-770(-)
MPSLKLPGRSKWRSASLRSFFVPLTRLERRAGSIAGSMGVAASKAGMGAVLVTVQLSPTTASAAPRTVRCMPWEEGSGAGAMLWCWCGIASMSRDASSLDAWRGARLHEKSSSTEAWAASWGEGATEWLTTPATGTAPACLSRSASYAEWSSGWPRTEQRWCGSAPVLQLLARAMRRLPANFSVSTVKLNLVDALQSHSTGSEE